MGESRTLNRARQDVLTQNLVIQVRLNRYELFQTLSLYLCTVPQSWKSYIFFCQNRETRFQSHFSFVYFRAPSSTVIRDTLIFRTLKQERNTQRENARIQSKKVCCVCVCACVKSSNQLGRLFITNLWMRGMISVAARNTDTVPFFFNF